MKSLYALVGMKHRGTEEFVASLPQGEPLTLVRELARQARRRRRPMADGRDRRMKIPRSRAAAIADDFFNAAPTYRTRQRLIALISEIHGSDRFNRIGVAFADGSVSVVPTKKQARELRDVMKCEMPESRPRLVEVEICIREPRDRR